MRERNVLYGMIFLLSATVITGWSPIVRAVTPTGPALYDGSDIYLGQVLSVVNQAGVITYTTYLPAVDGILQFWSDPGQGNGTLFSNTDIAILFEEVDCQGTAFVAVGTGIPWIHPWIVERTATGEMFKVASSTTQKTISSYDGAGVCSDLDTPTSFNVHKLKPVTLPFDVNNVTLPYRIAQ